MAPERWFGWMVAHHIVQSRRLCWMMLLISKRCVVYLRAVWEIRDWICRPGLFWTLNFIPQRRYLCLFEGLEPTNATCLVICGGFGKHAGEICTKRELSEDIDVGYFGSICVVEGGFNGCRNCFSAIAAAMVARPRNDVSNVIDTGKVA